MSEKELIIGMAIGDGHITKKGELCIGHSSIYRDYLYYKYNLLKENNIKCRKIYENNKISGYSTHSIIKFSTTRTFVGKEIREYLYPFDIKIIPDDLIITPIMWSFIYQDDGRQNKTSHYNTKINGVYERVDVDPWVNRYTIYTDSFNEKSIYNLQKSLLFYDVESSINYSNKNKYPHIHIGKKESKTNFKNLIDPYITECMRYKMNLPTYIIQE